MSTRTGERTADVRLELAKAWAAAGEWERAASGFRRILAADPDSVPARLQLGHTLLKLGHVSEALDCYAQVLAVAPDELEAQSRYHFLREELARASTAHEPPARLPNHADGKLDLNHTSAPIAHRSGWAAALRALEPLHNEAGVLLDSGIEENFARRHWHDGVRSAAVLDDLKRQGLLRHLATSQEQGIVPYTRPWVGVVHNPPNMPTWFHSHEAPQRIFDKEIWRTSLESCRGLFTFSEYAAEFLRATTQLPVSVVTHPTETHVRQFDFERFLANPRKKVVQIGWWLRQLSAIHRLPLTGGNPLEYEKVWLVPQFFADADAYLQRLRARELTMQGWHVESRFEENTRRLAHLDNSAYDALLAENITLVLLYDANANNAVVECIARATPLLINPLPAVVEYLGPDYPLYVEDPEQAAVKALDLDLLYRAHEYLKTPQRRRRLSFDHFATTWRTSAIYQSL